MRSRLVWSPSSIRIILWSLGLLPAICCGFTGLIPCVPHPMQAPPRIQSLAFDQYVLDFRRTPQRPKDMYFFYFPFRNVGDRTLKITKMQGSCSCLQPTLDKKDSKEYAPGETGEILLRVQAASQEPGDREYWVDVEYLDPEPQHRKVFLKLNLPKEQVWLEPKALVFYPGNSGREIPPQEISIKDLRSDRLKIIGASCEDPFVQLEIQEPESTGNDSQSIVSKILVSIQGPLPAGRRQPVIKIYTDDPAQQYHELRIPLLIDTPAVAADRTLSSDAD